MEHWWRMNNFLTIQINKVNNRIPDHGKKWVAVKVRGWEERQEGKLQSECYVWEKNKFKRKSKISIVKIKYVFIENTLHIHFLEKTKLLTVLELLLISGYNLKEFFKNKHNIFHYSLLQLPAHWRKIGQLF